MLTFDILENRCTPSISQVGGIVTINSFGGNDAAQVVEIGPGHLAVIQVQRDASGHILQREQAFLSGVTGVVFNGGSGADKFYMDPSSHLDCTAFGNDGDDYLQGGSGTNVLVGGAGNDTGVGMTSTDGIDCENVSQLF